MQSSDGWHARLRAIRIRATGKRNSSLAVHEPRNEETVGAFLRRCRETRHETLSHVSRTLRIRTPYLRAIEDDDWQALPNSVYARAFLRSYAIHVEADPEQVLNRAETVLDSRPGPDTPLPPSPARDRSLPGGALIGASVLLAIAAYAGWYYFTVEQFRGERVVSALPDRLLMELTPAERRLGAPAVESPAESPAAVEASGSAELQMAAGNGERTAAPDPVEPENVAAQEIRPGLPAIAAPIPGDPAARARTARRSAGAASDGIVFHAVEATYIEVRSLETNEVLIARLLRAGEQYRPPDRRGLVLSVGNAGGLEVVVDGVAIPRLGAAGAVMRHIPIDGELLMRRAGG